ncbi:MAG TPA: universal stress protein, partial [Ramlibacter sp.]
MYKRILVPTDGSPLSKKAVRSAVDLAASLGAELVALNVVPRYPTAFFEGAISLAPEDVARVERQWAERGQALADSVESVARKAGVKARAITVSSDLVAESVLA